mmetsp:Transcript_12442/g.34930  ORF Transcript_12442/g.34930 Transcript_12442/m.34930 type:complete len:706 (-) Transcript_12442:427-2544(-)
MASEFVQGLGRGLLAEVPASGTDIGHGADPSGYHVPFTFEELLLLCTTLWIIFLMGRLAGFLGLPELIGHLVAGIIVGPHAAQIAPKPDALMLAGELGLVLMVMEAGMEVDLQQLKVVGLRGVGVAFLGSLLPLAIGFGVAYGIFVLPMKEALAVGASLAPTSMGISLKVLNEGKVLNTPIGQLIIAAAVIDDVIALVLLSELEALENPTPSNFIIPIASSLAFIFGVGSIAVFVMPRILKTVLQRVHPTHMPPLLLGSTLLVTYALLPATHYGKSSYLLGAFLGGLCFCTAEPLMPVWHNNAYQILSWLLRVFFACTLGFEVPIQDLWTPAVLTMAAAFLLAFFGKFVTGAFGTPISARTWCIIGFAMSAWGEFAFVVATTSRELGSMSDDTFGAVVLAVLLSAFYSPLAVQATIMLSKRKAMRGAQESEPAHGVYFKATLNIKSRWGLTDLLLRTLHELELDIVEFRIQSSSPRWSNFLVFLRDRKLQIPINHSNSPTRLSQGDQIAGRVQDLRGKLAEAVGITNEELLESNRPSQGDPEERVICMLERWTPPLDDEHPELDEEIAFEFAHEVCAPAPAVDLPPKTLGGLVRKSMNPGGLGRTSAAPLARGSAAPVMSNSSPVPTVLGRTSIPMGTGQMDVPNLTRLSRTSGDSVQGKKFSLARQSGQPVVPVPMVRFDGVTEDHVGEMTDSGQQANNKNNHI